MTEFASQPSISQDLRQELSVWTLELLLKPLRVLIAAPCLLFLTALTAMLLRHPDVQFYQIDRIAFGLLLAGAIGRAVASRERLFAARASWPMLAITLMTLTSVAGQTFDHETWSLLASKFLVPFALFHIAAIVFKEESQLRQFEIFALLLLAYLSFTAIAFLVGAHSLIFPRFVLDESLGFHADRARGPLLQAVANGVSLNILGLLAVHTYRRRRSYRHALTILLTSLPLAILATMTRAVWLTFAGTVVGLIFVLGHQKQRWKTYLVLLGLAIVGFAILSSSHDLSTTLSDRWEERGPVDFRKAVYAGGWEMFWQHPMFGWGFHRMPAELPRYVSGYDEKVLYPHNTYLELMVEHGMLGLALYFWLMCELLRLRRGEIPPGETQGFLDGEFHKLWPILLIGYWINAALVVMSYQFVNGLVFALAGMLAGQQRRAEELRAC